MKKALFLISAFTFAPLILIYKFTLPPGVFWQDSGIFLSAIYTAGIAYPPGFPLYILLGVIFTKLFPFGDFVFKVHLLSAIFGSLAASIVAICAYILINEKAKQTMALAISIGSGLALGLSYDFWSQAINAESYALHALFVSVIILVAILILTKSKLEKTNLLYLLIGIWGLSFANHPQTIFLAFPIGYLMINNRLLASDKKKIAVLIFIFVFSALIPYLYLPIRSHAMPDLNWGYPNSVGRFFNHVFARNYLSSGQASFSLFDSERLLEISKNVTIQYSVVGFLLAVWGFFILAKTKRLVAEFLLIFGVATVASALIYKATVEYLLWLIPVFIIFAIFIAIALKSVIYRFKFKAGLILLIAILTFQIIANFPTLDRSNYYYASDFGANILRPLDNNALIFITGDQAGTTTMYLQYVENFRPDVVILRNIDYARIILPDEKKFIQQKFPDLIISDFEGVESLDDVLNRLILANIESRSVYLFPKEIIGTLDSNLELIPAGLSWKVIRNDKLQMTNYKLDLKYWQFYYHDPSYYQKSEPKNFSVKLDPKDPLSKSKRISYIKYMADQESLAWSNLGDWYQAKGEANLAQEAYVKSENLKFKSQK